MAVQVTLELPPDIEELLRSESPQIDSDIKEVYALELFRPGRLTQYELSRVLGFDRFETDAFLKNHQVFTDSLTSADLEHVRQTLERVMS